MEPKYIPKKYIIPDTILEALICKNCNKYLTVLPIGIHPDGGNICGRCLYSKNAPSALFEYNSNDCNCIEHNIPFPIFGYLNHYFPCVNRYEGCKELLKFNNIRNHELTCEPTIIRCYYCSYEGIGSQYLHHFKTCHPKFYLNQLSFLVDLNEDERSNYLMKKEDQLLSIDIEFDKSQGKICLKINRLSKKINFMWHLMGTEGKVVTRKYALIDRNNNENITVFSRNDLERTTNLICQFFPKRDAVFDEYYDEVGFIN